MIPVTLGTERLTLDQPATADRELIAQYCSDPLFESYMTTPWPYEVKHATGFVTDYAPMGWRTNAEYTWAIRAEGVFVGVIGYREATRDIGYWLGAPHRGHGYMTEAAGAVVDWLFAQGRDELAWECVVGNTASAGVARKLGFAFTGVAPSSQPARDGTPQPSWHGVLTATDSRAPQPGWPTS